MNIRKLVAILTVAAIVSVIALTGCQKQGATSATSGGTSVAATNGTLAVGVDDTYPPMEYKTTDSPDDVGFDIDLAKAVAQKLNMQLKLVPTAWDGIFMALNAKKFDCIISSVSMTADRLKSYSFTKPYIANAQMIVVRKGDTAIKAATDLIGKNVGCQIGTTANDSATYLQQKKGYKFNLTTYDQIIQAFSALKAKRVEAVIVDEVVGEYYIKQSPNDYESASVNLTNEPIGVCLRKSDTALRDKVQGAIDSLAADGSLKKMSEQWFGKDLTSSIDTNLRTLG